MRNLRIDEFNRYHFLSELSFSPDGKHAAFVAAQGKEDESGYHYCLYHLNPADWKVTRLTSFGRERNYSWLDNNTLIFPSLRDKNQAARIARGIEETSIYRLSLLGGEAECILTLPYKVSGIKRVPDGYLFTAKIDMSKPDQRGKSPAELEAILRQMEEDKDYSIYDEHPFLFHQVYHYNRIKNRLYHLSDATGKITQLSPDYLNITAWELSPEKKTVIFGGYEYDSLMEYYHVAYVTDLSSLSTRRVVEPGHYTFLSPRYLDENTVTFCGVKDNQNHFANHRFSKLDLVTGDIDLYGEFDLITNYTVTNDNRLGAGNMVKHYKGLTYFITTQDSCSHLMCFGPGHPIERLTAATGSVDFFDICDDKVVFCGLRDMRLQELYTMDLMDPAHPETRITSFNEWVQEECYVAPMEPLSFLNEANEVIEGFVMKPKDYDPRKRYPGMLQLHGGPKNTYGPMFYHEMQYFANQGYFVFCCNPHGSEGKGESFADLIDKYGSIDFNDLMTFTDLVCATYPAIDEKRLTVTGGSYGGFMVNWIIGHTDRFAAACTQRSVASWLTQYLLSDIYYMIVPYVHLGDPWENTLNVISHSAVHFVDKAKTPTLVIHSDHDHRTFMSEGRQMYAALKMHGVPARFVVFHGEDHDLSRTGMPKLRIRRMYEIERWFKDYVF